MSMKHLVEAINGATSLVDGDTPGAVNTEFLQVLTDTSKVSALNLCELMASAIHGEYADCDPMDGLEHGYIELGAWLGSQELALRFMAMGSTLGLWALLTPTLLMPQAPKEMREMMAGGPWFCYDSEQGAKVTELIINHDEAYQLACIRREESNLARCYMELHDLVKKLEADLASHRQARRVSGQYPLGAGGGPY